MASFIYFYSKFTEEFLLLSAAGIFTLLSIYCYTWVVKKRRLGAARDQIPAGMVKVYLNQLINEAQFVRTQLFGLVGNAPPANTSAENFAAHFQAHAGSAPSSAAGAHAAHVPGNEISGELADRLKALQTQLAEKESMVVNINVEKSKLLEEVENFRQNEKAMGQAATGNNDELIQKIKALEERLEEYALFEDDLANLKRLQQENAQLKKQLETPSAPQVTAAPAVAPVVAAAPEPAKSAPEPEVIEAAAPPVEKSFLDQSAIDALLDGTPATPPTPAPSAKTEDVEQDVLAAATAASLDNIADLVDINVTTAAVAAMNPVAAPAEPAPLPEAASALGSGKGESEPKTESVPETHSAGISKTPEENFEKLMDSVENSLSAAPIAVAPAPPAVAMPEKSDEELLKEFENLLNS